MVGRRYFLFLESCTLGLGDGVAFSGIAEQVAGAATWICRLQINAECYHTLLDFPPVPMMKIVTGGGSNVWIEFKGSAKTKGFIAG